MSEIVPINYDGPLPLKLWVNGQLVWRIVNLGIEALHGLSFYQMLKNALDQAHEKTAVRPPRLVLLTGGASRLKFFQDLCKKRFPDAVFILCEEPEYSIAKGLAYSIRVDKNIQAFNEAIQAYVREDHIHSAVQGHMDSLVAVVADYMTDIGFQETKKHVTDWQTGVYPKLSDMNAAVQSDITARLDGDGVNGELVKMVENELNAACAQLQPQLDDICRRYQVPVGIMQLKGVELQSDSLAGAVPTPGVDALQRAVQVLITGIVAVIMLQIPGIQIVPVVLAAAAAILAHNAANDASAAAEQALDAAHAAQDAMNDAKGSYTSLNSRLEHIETAKQDVIADISTIRTNAEAGATAVQSGDIARVAMTGAYSDLEGAPSKLSDLINDVAIMIEDESDPSTLVNDN